VYVKVNEVFHFAFLFPDELNFSIKVTPIYRDAQAKGKKTPNNAHTRSHGLPSPTSARTPRISPEFRAKHTSFYVKIAYFSPKV